jgi:hypothetical protein
VRAGTGGGGSGGGGRTGAGNALICSAVRTSGGALRSVLKVSIEVTNSCSLGRPAAPSTVSRTSALKRTMTRRAAGAPYAGS